MKKAKIEQIGKGIQSQKSQDNRDKFLSEINASILEIRKSEKEKYSLLSCIFNCFYENKTTSLPQQTIYDYILQDIINYKGKMIVSFVQNGTNSMEIIDENNYIKKAHNIISRNKCLLLEGDNHISFDMLFIQKNKNLMYRNLFGREGKLFISAHKKIKKFKNIKNRGSKVVKKSKNVKNELTTEDAEDDYEIEILESEEEDSNTIELKQDNNNLSSDINPIGDNTSSDLTKITSSPKSRNINNKNNIGISTNQKDITLLNKKRKNNINNLEGDENRKEKKRRNNSRKRNIISNRRRKSIFIFI